MVFLQRKRAATEHVAVARHRLVPARHDARHGVAHLRQIPQEEVHGMRYPQRQDVMRVVHQDRVPDCVHAPNVTSAPRVQRGHVLAFAVGCADGQALRLGERIAALRSQLGQRRKPEEVAAQALPHDHVGVHLPDALQQPAGIAPRRQELVDAIVERIYRFLAGSGKCHAAFVAIHDPRYQQKSSASLL